MKLTYEEFLEAMNNLRDFLEERDKLDNVLKILSPTSTGVIEFGSKFIDDYIAVLEKALGDTDNWVSWFVFDNEFGKNCYSITLDDVNIYPICNEYDFYSLLKKLNERTV